MYIIYIFYWNKNVTNKFTQKKMAVSTTILTPYGPNAAGKPAQHALEQLAPSGLLPLLNLSNSHQPCTPHLVPRLFAGSPCMVSRERKKQQQAVTLYHNTMCSLALSNTLMRHCKTPSTLQSVAVSLASISPLPQLWTPSLVNCSLPSHSATFGDVRNSLPCEIRHIQSTTAFKTALKIHPFKFYLYKLNLYSLHLFL